MEAVVIKGEKREAGSKSATNNLRRNEKVPCVLYGTDENLHFSVDALDFRPLINEPGFTKANIEVDGETVEAFLKDAQFHPVTDQLLHADFQALVSGRKVITEIPVKLVGAAEGVKEGGRLNMLIRRLKVKALPEDLKEYIEVDVTHLAVGKSVKVRELDLGNIEVLTTESSPIASVDIPRALKSKLGLEEEEVEGVEGEEGAEAAEGGEAGEGDTAPSGDAETPAEG